MGSSHEELGTTMDQERLVEHIRSEFSPDNYPAHSLKIMPLLDFMREELHKIFTSNLVKRDGKLLEVGCGPTMYTAMSASLAFNHIVMADLVPANIREVRKWVDAAPDAKYWTVFAERQAQLEGYTDDEKGASTIIARTRKALHDVTLCNITEPGVLCDRKEKFGVVVTCLCLDSGSVDEAAHQRATANLAAFLNPGGLLIAFGLTGNPSYTACTKTFSSPDSNEALIKNSITKAGLTVVHWAENKHLPHMEYYVVYGNTYVIAGKKGNDDFIS